MIGWRVGWIVAPPALVDDIGLVCISNVVCQVGIAQTAVAVALEAGDEDVAAATAEWQRRRDVILAELDGLPVIPPHGGWSMLLDVRALGHACRRGLGAAVSPRPGRRDPDDELGLRAGR